MERGGLARGAACPAEAGEIRLHGFLGAEDGEGCAQDPAGAGVGGHDDAVVHPFALAAGGDDAGAAEVGQMAGDFGLALAEDRDEIADADFPAVDEVQEAEAGAIGERGKEPGEAIVLWGTIHSSNIRFDGCNRQRYIRISVCEEAPAGAGARG